ncbi:MAG: hypothetical protein ACOYNY_07140 [Caldilineaceae bacterium]
MGDGKAHPLFWAFVVLAVAIIGVSQPIVDRLVDAYWSTTPKVDLAITESVTNTPEQAVMDYWDNVDDNNFQKAWESLSPRFQQSKHNNNYNAYVTDFEWVLPCSIKTTDVVLADINNTTAKVNAHVIYGGTNCPGEFDFEHSLLFDSSTELWLLDRVTKLQN